MAYQVLALKWRPAGFEQVVAQDHVTKTLQNAIASGRIANAYLFAGPRGVGKTTTARIFAKALNCKEGPTPRPCNKCTNCTEIAEGRSLDVLEIDGASNRGIDEIRNLRENIRYAPSNSKYKIYIVDEVHMLTTEAFNALLKTLEEPPEHVKFIFATTEPHKVPATILSRCQRFDFKRIPVDQIIAQLRLICEKEGIQIDEESLLILAKKADGSLRDAESLLDQLVSFVGAAIRVDQVLDAFSVVSQELYFEFSEILKERDLQKGLRFVDRLINSGYDIKEFLMGLIEHFRNLLFARALRDGQLIETSDTFRQRYLKESGDFSEEDLLRYIQILSEAEYAIRRSPNPRIRLEMTVVKLIKLDRSVTLEEVIRELEARTETAAGKRRVEEPQAASLFGKTASAAAGTAVPSPKPGQKKSPAAGNRAYSEPETSSAAAAASGPAAPPAAGEEPSASSSPESDVLEEPSPLTLEQIKHSWNALAQSIQKRRLYVSVFLQEGEPVSFDGRNLQIGFSRENGFQIEALKRNREVIQQAFRELFGQSVKVSFTRADIQPPKHVEIFDGPSVPERKAPKKIDPMVRRILDMFDGELITVGG